MAATKTEQKFAKIAKAEEVPQLCELRALLFIIPAEKQDSERLQ